jgi:hypothetical protein
MFLAIVGPAEVNPARWGVHSPWADPPSRRHVRFRHSDHLHRHSIRFFTFSFCLTPLTLGPGINLAC